MSKLVPDLRDYTRWLSLNTGGDFNLFDYAYGVLKSEGLSADLMIAIIRLCWPEFILHAGCVLLKEQFLESKFDEFAAQGLKGKELELWCNMFCVDGMLEGVRGGSAEHIAMIAGVLSATWGAKLKSDHPNLKFEVQVLTDEDVGDTCVTFFQPDYLVASRSVP